MIKTPDHKSGRVSFFLSRLSYPIQRGAVAGTASADVESANICGYQNVAITNGFQFFTITFEDISKVTNSLSQLTCKRTDGENWLRTNMKDATIACAGAITLQKINPGGSYGTVYKYYGKNASDTFGPGWYEGDRKTDGSNLITEDNDILFAPGEGVIVYCGKEMATFLVSGSVQLNPTTVNVGNGFVFGGNCTPVDIQLSKVICTRGNGEEWLRTNMKDATIACAGAITLQKITSGGSYGTVYKYYGKNASDTFGPGWYEGDRKTDGSNLIKDGNDVTFKPGEGWILYCGKDASRVVVPQPIKVVE